MSQETVRLVWYSATYQGSIQMGDFDSEEDARAAITWARAELMDQCGSDEQREGIAAGHFAIERQ